MSLEPNAAEVVEAPSHGSFTWSATRLSRQRFSSGDSCVARMVI
jgi:hypothetical protein